MKSLDFLKKYENDAYTEKENRSDAEICQRRIRTWSSQAYIGFRLSAEKCKYDTAEGLSKRGVKNTAVAYICTNPKSPQCQNIASARSLHRYHCHLIVRHKIMKRGTSCKGSNWNTPQ
jgi:hypothetical protein